MATSTGWTIGVIGAGSNLALTVIITSKRQRHRITRYRADVANSSYGSQCMFN
ncbi:MAG: hypothetical protein ACK6BM_12515 [Cyanobacteriota bacterium]